MFILGDNNNIFHSQLFQQSTLNRVLDDSCGF